MPTRLTRFRLPSAFAVALLLFSGAPATQSEAAEPEAAIAESAPGDTPTIKVFKSPTCGCCSKWVSHLEANGFEVETTDVPDVRPIKRANGVPRNLDACHTGFVGGYVVEGHVPARELKRLLSERPKVAGLAVPGMPEGSPGMEGPNPEAYDVVAFDEDGEMTVFSHREP